MKPVCSNTEVSILDHITNGQFTRKPILLLNQAPLIVPFILHLATQKSSMLHLLPPELINTIIAVMQDDFHYVQVERASTSASTDSKVLYCRLITFDWGWLKQSRTKRSFLAAEHYHDVLAGSNGSRSHLYGPQLRIRRSRKDLIPVPLAPTSLTPPPLFFDIHSCDVVQHVQDGKCWSCFNARILRSNANDCVETLCPLCFTVDAAQYSENQFLRLARRYRVLLTEWNNVNIVHGLDNVPAPQRTRFETATKELDRKFEEFYEWIEEKVKERQYDAPRRFGQRVMEEIDMLKRHKLDRNVLMLRSNTPSLA